MTSGPPQVVGGVVVEGGRAFVIRRSPTRRLFPNCCDIPGGHVEPDKHPEARWIAGSELELLLAARRPGDDLTYRIVARAPSRL